MKTIWKYINPINGYFFVKEINDFFGFSFLSLLTSSFFGIVGGIYYLTTNIQFPYWKEVGHDANIQQEMAAIAIVPWTCKGFIGIISDCYPILGFYKTTYLYIYTFIGIPCILALAFMPLTVSFNFPIVAGLLFFGINIYTASYDLLIESKYMEMMRKYPAIKANVLNYAWICTLLGELLPSSLVGIISNKLGSRSLFLIFIPLTIPPIIALFFGGIIEDKAKPEKNNKIDFQRIRNNIKLLFLATLQSFAAVMIIVVSEFSSTLGQLIYIIIVTMFIVALAYFWLNIKIASFSLYIFLSPALYVNLQAGLEYFYIADEDCVEDGPKFEIEFLRSIGTITTTLASILAVYIFQVFMKTWKFRYCFWVTTLLRMIASISDILIVNRWTVKIGVSDKIVYLMGYSIFSEVTYMLDFLPTMVMISKLTPPYLEATMMSFLSGNFNFGYNASFYIGVFFYKIFNIVSLRVPEEGIECDFSNLTTIIILGHIILPAISIVLVFFLIPNVYLFDIINLNTTRQKTIINSYQNRNQI